MRWGATGKCQYGFAELEAKQTCDYYGCTSTSDCHSYPASTVCGAGGYCDMRWGATGKCQYGYAGGYCDMRWGATGKCQYSAAELESKQTCDYYGCTSTADCHSYPASTVCGAGGYCDMRWGATGKCQYGFAELEANSSGNPSTDGYCVSTSPSNPCGRCWGESYCGNNVIGVYYCRYPKDTMCPSAEDVMV